MFLSFQYRVRPSKVAQILALTLALILLTTLFFIPNFSGFILITLNLFLLEIGLIGYSCLLGVNLDTFFFSTLIICTGYGINYTIFFFFAYLSATASTQEERIQQALSKCGYAILQSTISTCFILLPFLLIPSYFFSTLFITFFLAASFGIFLSIFVMPVFIPFCCLNLYMNAHAEESPILLSSHAKKDEDRVAGVAEEDSVVSSVATLEEMLQDDSSTDDELVVTAASTNKASNSKED